MPSIDLSGYIDRNTREPDPFNRLLIKKAVRESLADQLFELMKSPLNHFLFQRDDINFFVAPSLDSVDESRFLVADETRSSQGSSGIVDPDLPGLYIVFGDDSVDREQITNINWSSESTLTISYFRKSMDNPDFDPSKPVTSNKGGNPRKIPYSSKSTNLLVEDLETVALIFDLEIQKTAQAGVFSGVIDTQLTDIVYAIPTEAGRVYGSLELSYNVKYRVDYRHLGRS